MILRISAPVETSCAPELFDRLVRLVALSEQEDSLLEQLEKCRQHIALVSEEVTPAIAAWSHPIVVDGHILQLRHQQGKKAEIRIDPLCELIRKGN